MKKITLVLFLMLTTGVFAQDKTPRFHLSFSNNAIGLKIQSDEDSGLLVKQETYAVGTITMPDICCIPDAGKNKKVNYIKTAELKGGEEITMRIEENTKPYESGYRTFDVLGGSIQQVIGKNTGGVPGKRLYASGTILVRLSAGVSRTDLKISKIEFDDRFPNKLNIYDEDGKLVSSRGYSLAWFTPDATEDL